MPYTAEALCPNYIIHTMVYETAVLQFLNLVDFSLFQTHATIKQHITHNKNT